MSLKYYNDLLSQPCRALDIILRISRTKYENCPVALRKREHLTAEFREQVNRFQKVPCIVETDTNFKLSESVAILRYLAAKNLLLPELYPNNIMEQSRIDEFLEWQHLAIRSACGHYFLATWLEPQVFGIHSTPEKIQQLKETMKKQLNILENIWLKNDQQKFIIGDHLTAADIFGACELEQTLMTDYSVREHYPRIAAWLNRVKLASNPYYDNAHRDVYAIVENNKSRIE